MNKFSVTLKEALDTLALPWSEAEIDLCHGYAALLSEANTTMNLTAIITPEDVAVKHFADALYLLKAENFSPGATVVDIGTGAGFPGLPLAIFRPDLNITLLDSLKKRCHFLAMVVRELNLENVAVVCGRAEEIGKMVEYRETFQYATARAVASLPVLLEYAFPLLSVGGSFLPLKGTTEAADFDKALRILGGVLEESIHYNLPLREEKRTIYRFVKTAPTPQSYPRRPGMAAKRPLD